MLSACESPREDIEWTPKGDYDLVGETKYLRIWSDMPVTLCAGDIHDLDAHVDLGRSILDISDEQMGTIDVLLTSNVSVLDDEGCTPPQQECYRGDLDVVLSTTHGLYHELGHAILTRRPGASAFIHEGFSEALSEWEESTLEPDVIDEFFGDDRVYGNSRTLMQWLLTYHDHQKFQVFLDVRQRKLEDGHPSPTKHALARAYGWTVTDLIEQMAATMPASFLTAYGRTCPEDSIAQIPGPLPRWGFTVELDCASEHTRGLWPHVDREPGLPYGPDAQVSLNTLSRRYRIDLPAAGTYRLATAAPLVVMRPCVDPLADPASASPTFWGPRLFPSPGWWSQLNHVDISIDAPGTVVLEVGGTSDGPTIYEVSLILIASRE